MGEFVDVCLGFPTVLFGGALVVVVGFWGLVLVGAADSHGPGHHGAAGGHSMGNGGSHGAASAGGEGLSAHAPVHGAGGHASVHGAGGHASGARTAGGHDGGAHAAGGRDGDGHDVEHPGGSGLLAAAGLDGVPVTVVLSLLIALGWFLSLAGSAALNGAGLHGPARAAADAALIAAALAGAWTGAWVLVRPLRRLFPYERPPSRADFVGLVCVVRTGTVTERFGQAEVTAPDGSTAIVQVRRPADDTGGPLAAGRTALLYDYDPQGGFFWAAPYQDPAAGPPPPGARALS
ncbi:hypothetical protein RVR_4088 [Actinacidiphila reveromycinica]|uniref:DUF1449 family protein n=1 Tax=Actinacidiphila reveromycinica TaxID=659352 RepID=A0A7U3VNV9_9ACTN|nr:hypothetical protein [Streptomyces sp. SN-593]BBA98049.1 hypothetical protein RVR_4088 [Streptomyces sp. SN-593]